MLGRGGCPLVSKLRQRCAEILSFSGQLCLRTCPQPVDAVDVSRAAVVDQVRTYRRRCAGMCFETRFETGVAFPLREVIDRMPLGSLVGVWQTITPARFHHLPGLHSDLRRFAGQPHRALLTPGRALRAKLAAGRPTAGRHRVPWSAECGPSPADLPRAWRHRSGRGRRPAR